MARGGARHAGLWRDYTQTHYCYMVAKKVRRLEGLQTARKLQPSINRPDNEADFFTKILPEPAFRTAEDRMMKKIK